MDGAGVAVTKDNLDGLSVHELIDLVQKLAAVQAAAEEQLRAKLTQVGEYPPGTVKLLNGEAALDDEQKENIRETVDYVVEIVQYAHLSAGLKNRLRKVMGLGAYFTTNLVWAGQWNRLKEGCAAHMHRLGGQLKQFYEDQNLRAVLGSYEPPIIGPAAAAAATPAPPSPGLLPLPAEQPSETRQSLVPQQCSPAAFEVAGIAESRSLECTYIHFVRMIALALDDTFQRSVNRVLDGLLVDGGVSSGGIKGYERMWNKMMSVEDHFFCAKPRPAANIDVVRCLATFQNASDMAEAFDKLRLAFGGGFLKFKNGMSWDDAMAQSRYHLRIVLATVNFCDPERPTIGDLRDDPGIQAIWNGCDS